MDDEDLIRVRMDMGDLKMADDTACAFTTRPCTPYCAAWRWGTKPGPEYDDAGNFVPLDDRAIGYGWCSRLTWRPSHA